MKKKFFVLPMLFALCTMALPAISQNQNDQMRFQGMDRNQDGIITRNEWRGNDQSFSNEDWNGDGILSGNEVRPGARRVDDRLSSERNGARFRDLDRNQDGVIARNEWNEVRQAFDSLDANRNGVLSRDEFFARNNDQEGRFANLDRNNNGVIARNEWNDDRQAFDSLDANRNGVLSRDEFFARASNVNASTITCSSSNGQRADCNADTRGGVRLVRQISGSPCTQGSTWGYDARGIWVDRGCRAEFEVAGYVNRGYSGNGQNRLTIEPNNNVSWQSQGTTNARVFSQRDNEREQLFAEGRSGTQAAPWIVQGHQYVFILRDFNGAELARNQVDLRTSPGGYQRGYPGNNRRSAQPSSIGAGTTILVRTNGAIDTRNNDGQVFSGIVNQDVTDSSGNVAIPRGSDVELVVKTLSNNELALDLESVTVNGQRYGIMAGDTSMSGGAKDGIGANQRTGKYIGGGALLGAIIGAIAGGGKGAAIGAGAGAAAGAGTQVLTRGRNVSVPAESLLTFQLEQPLQLGVADYGITRDGRHYHDQNR